MWTINIIKANYSSTKEMATENTTIPMAVNSSVNGKITWDMAKVK